MGFKEGATRAMRYVGRWTLLPLTELLCDTAIRIGSRIEYAKYCKAKRIIDNGRYCGDDRKIISAKEQIGAWENSGVIDRTKPFPIRLDQF